MVPEKPFQIVSENHNARRGTLFTSHGVVQTPAFMPVGTQATVKGVTPHELRELKAEILLVNAYHLAIRPGARTIGELGGVHRFMGWNGPILSDSGGFQVFSLASLREVSEDGVRFRSHLDGAEFHLTPEGAVSVQEELGVDVMMMLDVCPAHTESYTAVEAAVERTARWAKRSKLARQNRAQLLFGIIQGGTSRDLRRRSVEETAALEFDGYGIGGLAVGEPSELMHQTVAETCDELPRDQVRYLMGVGTPQDIVRAVAAGVDLFDCVIPTRSARFGRLYVGDSYINIRNRLIRTDPRPICEECDCYTCRNFSRAYLSHLIHSGEVLAVVLATIHNLRFYQRLMENIRQAIQLGTFPEFESRILEASSQLDFRPGAQA